MIVIEGTSLHHRTDMYDLSGVASTVVSTKRPSPNTDYLCCRDINWRKPTYSDIPFMCYKWMTPNKGRTPSLKNVWKADHKKWDAYFKTFKPKKHPDPSSGTCAAFCAIERWKPDKIGLIGMDWVLDNNKEWFHDARAELECLKSLVEVIDLREWDIDKVPAIYNETSLMWEAAHSETKGQP